MAVSTTSYFNNAIVGQTQIGGGVDLYSSSTEPSFAVGTAFMRSDGNVFRFGHFGAATNRGAAVATDISESCLADTDNAVIAPASAVAVAGETMKPGAIGSHYFEMTLAATTADQYAGGYVVITDDTGEGYTYRVKGNTATDNPATGNIRVELYDRLQVALDATSDVAINGCRWANLEGATTTDYDVCGVSMETQAAADYGWVCSKGVVGYLDSGGCTAGQAIAPSATAGALADAAAATENIVGICLIAGDDTGHSVGRINVD
jgi:hypothetical protein